MERSRQGASNANSRRTHRPAANMLAIAITGIMLLAGCHACSLLGHHNVIYGPSSYLAMHPVVVDETLASARARFDEANVAEARQQQHCVDLYYHAAILAWHEIECGNQTAVKTYQDSLSSMIATASRYGRLDPRGRLMIATTQGYEIVPITYYGFAWKPSDFSQVLPAAKFDRHDLRHHYYTPGIGLSLVAVRQSSSDEEFYRPRQTFPATAVLRPAQAGAVLEFYNPLLFDSLSIGPVVYHLDRDLTASLAYLKDMVPSQSSEGFFNPGLADVRPKLVMLEPYQAGKIPVIFIHGLWSDPLTWADATNALRVQGDIYRRYQFWYFRYPTGGDLLASAATLRDKLLLARETCDPQHSDPALEQMVLVGHSMGGLVAQLQVTYSCDILWRHAAKQPIEAVRTTAQVREELQRSFFFDPSPLVKRVVFIATPHRGANMARRLIGRAATNFVHESAEEEATYRTLMDNNRNVFFEYLWRTRPTTIDLLEPDNPLLGAMAQMPVSRCVRLHSIIGTAGMTLSGEASDGVVPVSSASQPGTCSEQFVSARHQSTNKVDESVVELQRILRVHEQNVH